MNNLPPLLKIRPYQILIVKLLCPPTLSIREKNSTCLQTAPLSISVSVPGRINIHYFLLIKSCVCNSFWQTANFAVLCWSVHVRQGRVPFSLWASISSSSDNEAGDNQRLCTKTGGLLWSWPKNNDAFNYWMNFWQLCRRETNPGQRSLLSKSRFCDKVKAYILCWW